VLNRFGAFSLLGLFGANKPLTAL